jgi:hypothetical protein
VPARAGVQEYLAAIRVCPSREQLVVHAMAAREDPAGARVKRVCKLLAGRECRYATIAVGTASLRLRGVRLSLGRVERTRRLARIFLSAVRAGATRSTSSPGVPGALIDAGGSG